MARPDIGHEQQVENIFLSLAEQVKLPFVQILHEAELLAGSPEQYVADSRRAISLASQSAIRLIDGYLLSVQLQRKGQLQLEPVSLSSLLYDTAEALNDSAAAHNCRLELSVAGKYGPVMSHSRALKSALVNIGHSFIESVPLDAKGEERVIKLAVRRSAGGISAGVFADHAALSSALLKRARRMTGKSHQPLAEFSSDNAAGIFIADRLLSQCETTMRVAQLQGRGGLAATLLPSRQLSLV